MSKSKRFEKLMERKDGIRARAAIYGGSPVDIEALDRNMSARRRAYEYDRGRHSSLRGYAKRFGAVILSAAALSGVGVALKQVSPEAHRAKSSKSEVVTVQYGQSPASIAESFTDQDHDYRVLEETIEQETGGATLQPGEQLQIPDDLNYTHPDRHSHK